MKSRDAALRYARAGFAVFQLSPGTKEPFFRSHGVYDATKNAETIDKWDHCNIGIATGKVSNLLIIDIDPRNGGDISWDSWTQEHGLIDTLRVFTAGGGIHLYLQYPGDRTFKAHPLPGVDVLANGRYAVAPPSVVRGKRYIWEGKQSLAPCPSALLDLIVHTPEQRSDRPLPQPDMALGRRIKRAAAYVQNMPKAVSGSGGHNATFNAAVALVRGFLLPEDVALQILEQHYNPHCDPPWSSQELAHKVKQAAKSSRAEFGYLLTGNNK